MVSTGNELQTDAGSGTATVEAAIAATDAVVIEVVKPTDPESPAEAASIPPPPPTGLPSLHPDPTVNPDAEQLATVVKSQPTSISTKDYKSMAKLAAATAKLDRLASGSKSVFQAKMSDIGALGIGMQLYFMLTKYLAVTFLLMGLASLPALILNTYGNGITTKLMDPLQFGRASLGNQGVSDEYVNDAKKCLPVGTIDCTWNTVDTPFTSDPVTVSWVVTISDCAYSLIFLFFFLFYRYKAGKAIDEHLTENLTPGKYAVFVKGLPADATEREILDHFNDLYDLTKEEMYYPLWFGCCWGKRRKVRHTLSRNAVNRGVVKNVDHLAGTTSVTKEWYLGTWIAEVSIGHPTGGLLRTFLSMEALTKQIDQTRILIQSLEREKRNSMTQMSLKPGMAKYGFKPRDEKLIHTSRARLDQLCEQLEHKKSKISALKKAASAKEKHEQAEQAAKLAAASLLQSTSNSSQARAAAKAKAKMAAAAASAKSAALATRQALNMDACECAFVVFNNLESRRRCLRDYRNCTSTWAYRFQPTGLRFRQTHALVVVPAPEPSNILWENLEITDRGRFYRRSATNFVTFLLLLLSAMIISAAQSAQQQFKDKLPPPNLCESGMPQVWYGQVGNGYSTAKDNTGRRLQWKLKWDQTQQCPVGSDGAPQYYVSYDNGVQNPLVIKEPAVWTDTTRSPSRCLEKCVSETSTTPCDTMGCLDKSTNEPCFHYDTSHTLYCLCSASFSDYWTRYGMIQGPKRLYSEMIPCRGYIADYIKKNVYMMVAAAVIVIVNLILNTILRSFATYERHSSESAKATAIAAKMFMAQFLNTAIIVLLVNASLGTKNVPVVGELLKGRYKDFQREWYPAVGMGITTTMLINAFVPQIVLCIKMFVIAPLKRCLQRRSIRTQAKMNALYAGPSFDISVRYPMVLNSLFVTMAFCGGSPVLLFIAAVTAAGTFWFDKLSILHLYSVKTAYDEELGELALGLLPYTLVIHLAFSTWMYGNPQLMKATVIDLPAVLRFFRMNALVDKYGDNNEALYQAFREQAGSIDILGEYGLVVKVVRANVMVVFLFFIAAIASLLLSTVWMSLLFPIVKRVWEVIKRTCSRGRKPIVTRLSAAAMMEDILKSDAQIIEETGDLELAESKPKKVVPDVIIPEFTDVFRKSVKLKFRPDTLLGFERNEKNELIRKWREEVVLRGGLKRQEGELMRTWEAMQAPVKSYAIEMNDRYRLAVEEVGKAALLLRRDKNKVVPMVDEGEVVANITATEPVTLVLTEVGSTVEPVVVNAGSEPAVENTVEPVMVNAGSEPAVETEGGAVQNTADSGTAEQVAAQELVVGAEATVAAEGKEGTEVVAVADNMIMADPAVVVETVAAEPIDLAVADATQPVAGEVTAVEPSVADEVAKVESTVADPITISTPATREPDSTRTDIAPTSPTDAVEKAEVSIASVNVPEKAPEVTAATPAPQAKETSSARSSFVELARAARNSILGNSSSSRSSFVVTSVMAEVVAEAAVATTVLPATAPSVAVATPRGSVASLTPPTTDVQPRLSTSAPVIDVVPAVESVVAVTDPTPAPETASIPTVEPTPIPVSVDPVTVDPAVEITSAPTE